MADIAQMTLEVIEAIQQKKLLALSMVGMSLSE